MQELLAYLRSAGSTVDLSRLTTLHCWIALMMNKILLEFKYLKATIAADLKIKKPTDPQTKKYEFIQLPVSELKTGIKSVLYPTNHQMDSVEVLLDKMFNVQSQAA